MSTAAVCPRVTLTIQISEVLFDAIRITAEMSETTVNAFIGSTLRETQVAFFHENSESLADVVVLDVRATAMHPSVSEARVRGDLGTLQRAILDHLVDAPTRLPGVYDMREVRRTLQHSHHAPAVSRAVHKLVRDGVLEWMAPANEGEEFIPANEGQVRYVRRR